MRTIEEIVNELKQMAEPSTESHYNADVRYCQKLLDEILEISKANESVKGDLISKSEVINIVESEIALNLGAHTDVALCNIRGKVKQLPTVSNDGWIPCSERLPEENIEVDVTVEEIDGDRYTQASWLQERRWVIKKSALRPKVIAWRNRPQPYKENENG